jgi:hypothetical protein
LDLYAKLVKDHPAGRIKTQAAELQFILEAPRLPIGEDEYVQFPEWGKKDEYVDKWGTYGSRGKGGDKLGLGETPGEKVPEREAQNPLITVFFGVLALGVAFYSTTLVR